MMEHGSRLTRQRFEWRSRFATTHTNRKPLAAPARAVGRPGPIPGELERLFLLSPALLCVAGTNGYFQRVNPAFRKTLGHSEAALLSLPFIAFVHPDDRQATRKALRRISAGVPAVDFEHRYRHANGSYRWLQWNTTPVVDGELLYATALDITQTKHAQERFQALIHTAPDAMIIADLRGKILTLNRAADVLFGYPSNELPGQSIDVLVTTGLLAKHREHRDAQAREVWSRLTGDALDLRGVRRGGGEFPVEISVRPVGSGQDRFVVCAVRDVSRRQQRERELQDRELELAVSQRQLQAMAERLILAEESERRRIAMGLHDDVSQMLVAAKRHLGELLEEALPGTGDSSAREAQRLVDQAVQTTRTLTFELASAELYEVGLGAALQSVCERVEQDSGIRFHPPSDVHGHPIPEQTRVVLYRAGRELIRNVVKHSMARMARLSLSVNGNSIRLTVEDDGHGFDAAQGAQCPHSPAGIGLFSITQQLDPIGGKLEIASAPGCGTRATLSVPQEPRTGAT